MTGAPTLNRLSSRLLCIALVAAAVGLCLWLRTKALIDDRTYADENSVILPAAGISRDEPWPVRFRQRDVLPEPSIWRALVASATSEPYPPLMHVLFYFVRVADPSTPVLTARRVCFLAGMALLLSVFVWVRRNADGLTAAVATFYLAASPGLTTYAQEIKWAALAPLLALIATVNLVAIARGGHARNWVFYASSLLLLLHSHYFCAFALPAHLAFLAMRARSQLGAWLKLVGAIGVLSLPWVLWAIPKQYAWDLRYYQTMLAGLPNDAWYQPVSLRSVLGAYAFEWYSAWGLQTSVLRMRQQIPLVAFLAWALFVAMRARGRASSDLAFLAIGSMLSASICQTILALKAGHVISLTAGYFVGWFPLVIVATVLGVFAPRGFPLLRGAALAAAIACSGWNSLLFSIPGQFRPGFFPGNVPEIATAVDALPVDSYALVHRTDRRAKVFNALYRGRAFQAIWPLEGAAIPEHIQALVLVSTIEDSQLGPPPGWHAFEDWRGFGHTRLAIAHRQALGHDPTDRGIR